MERPGLMTAVMTQLIALFLLLVELRHAFLEMF